jgi:beta-galactosidase
MMRVNRFTTLLVVILAATSVAQTGAQRQRLSMDPEWRFTLGDPPGAERPSFDDRGWRALDLPHDWSIEGSMRQNAPGGGQAAFLPGGTGWYRKSFRMPETARGLEARLDFDGASVRLYQFFI